MSLKNGVMLITYPDSLGRNLSELRAILDRDLAGAVSGIHILPFYPSSSDRGFAPVRYDSVDPRFGDWNDLAELSKQYDLMFDFMINHLSSQAPQFQDFVNHKDSSPWADLFIRYNRFWPAGRPTAEDIARIYRRKPRPPRVEVRFADGSNEKVWCTFRDDQIDLNLPSDTAWQFIGENLRSLAARGAAVIRLDAVAYTTKKAGRACFFEEPEIWEILERVRSILNPSGVEILPEVHEHYSYQLKLAEHGYRVYDFALPLLLLYSLHSKTTAALAHWLQTCPRQQFTTLDTHDGIGVVDARGLLSDEQIDLTREWLFSRGAGVKRIYNTAVYNNLDIYQLNCTYYSALGHQDNAYLIARAVQIFAPGIPMVYYVGLLAGRNDVELVERTRNGRDINRHSYTVEEVARETQRPVVRKLLELLRFRNQCPAFGGECRVSSDGAGLTIRRENAGHTAELSADLKNRTGSILYGGPDGCEHTWLLTV